jgi:NAD(P)-dependent dehydrogenase (short-subunit alcohol dehydrogenase family)
MQQALISSQLPAYVRSNTSSLSQKQPLKTPLKMAEISNRALPKGSTVLVTGANGFLGAHIADQFLAQGYKVRGTVRDTKRDAWLVDHFGKLYGKDNFELVAVTEMEKEGAFDEAVKGMSLPTLLKECQVSHNLGVDAVAHSAGVMSFDHDPNKVIPITIAGAVNALKSAYAEPSVKRFVLTSSSAAALSANTPAGSVITVETWNEQAVKDAWADPPYTPERASTVYFASKTQSEQAVWKFHKENRAKRPDLVVNAGSSQNPHWRVWFCDVGTNCCFLPPQFSRITSLDRPLTRSITDFAAQQVLSLACGWDKSATTIAAYSDVRHFQLFPLSGPYQFS